MVQWEDFGLVLVYSLGSLVWLFVLTKLMGNRQMSQLTLFDYIIGISIGSIAAEMASHPEEDAWLGLIAMTIYALVAVGFNVLNDKSLKARRVLIGSPLVLLDHGQLYRQNLKRAKLDLNELLAECRSAGYFDLSELEMILMEVNGKLSFLPVSQNRPGGHAAGSFAGPGTGSPGGSCGDGRRSVPPNWAQGRWTGRSVAAKTAEKPENRRIAGMCFSRR